MAGFQPIEEMFYNGFMGWAGDPVFLGLLVIAFFFIFVLLQNLRFDGKLVVLIPACLLALAFFMDNLLLLLFALALSLVLFYAFYRLFQR